LTKSSKPVPINLTKPITESAHPLTHRPNTYISAYRCIHYSIELEIDREVVEDQLMAWSHLLPDGKRLRIDISVIYREVTQSVATRTQQTTRRGGVTAIQLAERAELLEEQEASGLTTVWTEVYSLMRCTGPPCQGTYCWRDPDNRKHYKLDTSVLTKLVDYAEEGNTLRRATR
jgi:hypothetical protein